MKKISFALTLALALAACGPTDCPIASPDCRGAGGGGGGGGGDGGGGGGGDGGGSGGGYAKSYWPLSSGSRWSYKITDPERGVFSKVVEMNGKVAVPGGNGEAFQMVSTEPDHREVSWQIEANGVVSRVREDDFRNGALSLYTVWDPSTVKSISAAHEKGWSISSSAHEVERQPDGTVTSDKPTTYVWTVQAVDETVVVPAGTFKAIRIARTRPDKADYLRTYWLAPGVGKVKEDGQRLEELESYSVK